MNKYTYSIIDGPAPGTTEILVFRDGRPISVDQLVRDANAHWNMIAASVVATMKEDENDWPGINTRH